MNEQQIDIEVALKFAQELSGNGMAASVIRGLAARSETAEKDAARYRFIRNFLAKNLGCGEWGVAMPFKMEPTASFDEAIDAMRVNY